MLSLAEARAALKECEVEAFWKPAWPGQILCVPLSDEGTSGGIEVHAYRERHTYQGLVIAVNKTRDVQVGDLINFDMGRGEPITTYLGETYFHITEENASAVDEEWREALEEAQAVADEPKEKLLPSGLWVSTDA